MGKLFFPSWLLKAWSLGQSMTWEFVRTVESQVPLSRPTESICIFTRSPGDLCARYSLRSTALECRLLVSPMLEDGCKLSCPEVRWFGPV